MLAMDGCAELGQMVNSYLTKWTTEPENDLLLTFPGFGRDSFLIEAACPRFGTGEGKAIIKESVRGYDLYLMCDVTNYRKTFKMYGNEVNMSPDDHFMDLKRLIAATSRKALRISVIMPYLYEGRQHRRNARESLDCALALHDLVNMGVDNIITFDAHDPRVQNSIPLTSFENVLPTYQMLKALFKAAPDLIINKEKMMVISPDEGAANRNIYYASILGLDMGLFYKRRDYTRIENGRNPIVAHEYLGTDVTGKDIIIADDILATGESMLDLARELKRRKAGRIFMFTTFGLFTDGTAAFDKAAQEGLIDYVFSTNLTALDPTLKTKSWFKEVNMAKYIAYILATLNHDSSISSLLNPAERIGKLLDCHRNK